MSFIGIIFVILFSYSTSFLYPHYWGGDSAQFLTIGKAWSMGKIPYRDMFDHKGPFGFFVDFLGFKLFGTKAGVSFFQMIFMLFTVNGLFSIAQEIKKKTSYGIVAVMIAIILMRINYLDGNLTEEYCLPFLTYSTLFQIRYLREEENQSNVTKHSASAAALYGLTFGVCLMTRVTNAITVCAGTLIITLNLLKQKEIKNLFENAVAFIGGFAVIVLPFAFYFAYHGVLKEMIYAMITYNIHYADKIPSWTYSIDKTAVLTVIYAYLPMHCVIGAGILAFTKKKYLTALFYILSGILEWYLCQTGKLYYQYALVYIPQILLLLNELFEEDLNLINSEGLLRMVAVSLLVFRCGAVMTNDMPAAANQYNKFKEYTTRGWEELSAMIPEEEKDSFVVWGTNAFKEYYLIEDCLPCYKYFVIQDWHSSFDEYIARDIRDTFKNGDATWIMTDRSTKRIDDVLENKYTLLAEQNDYALYHIN